VVYPFLAGTAWLRPRGPWWRCRARSFSAWVFSLSSPCFSYTDVAGVWLCEIIVGYLDCYFYNWDCFQGFYDSIYKANLVGFGNIFLIKWRLWYKSKSLQCPWQHVLPQLLLGYFYSSPVRKHHLFLCNCREQIKYHSFVIVLAKQQIW